MNPNHPTAADLFRAASRSVIVARFLHEWENGAYPTFEQMLIALVAALVEEHSRHVRELVNRHPQSPLMPPFEPGDLVGRDVDGKVVNLTPEARAKLGPLPFGMILRFPLPLLQNAAADLAAQRATGTVLRDLVRAAAEDGFVPPVEVKAEGNP